MISNLVNSYSIVSIILPNHQLCNMPNIYNSLIALLLKFPNDQKEIYQIITINMGNTFLLGFKDYCIKKFPLDHEILKLFVSR